MAAFTLRLRTITAFILILALHILAQDEEPDYSCSPSKPCKIGCCGPPSGGKSVCGLGPEFCGTGCIGNCNYKSECDPGWGAQWSNRTACPLNVCCSKFGFCGTTAEFCNGAVVASPSCARDLRTSNKRTIAYYEGWNLQKPCGRMEPEEIPLGYYTHINFAFALINPITYRMMAMDEKTASLYKRVTGLKAKQSSLQVWIAIGGWAMNDPDQATRYAFSDIARSRARQEIFFDSLITFMKQHNFDGVDIDWEYPGAEDRSGRPEDFVNLVTFLGRLRQRLNTLGKHYGLTITLPASYWYLQHFDIQKIEPHVDWLNMMTYDIHGTWDADIKSLGPYAMAHTNLTEIHSALELLWRNNINPERVVLGLGFYGRSFTMKDPSCMAPGCEFTAGGNPGPCSEVAGVLSGYEIREVIKNEGAKVTFDEKAGAKIVTWGKDQWVSYDDAETLKVKVDYANERCLGGTMVWAVDLDPEATEDLGKAMGKQKANVLEDFDAGYLFSDLGTLDREEL